MIAGACSREKRLVLSEKKMEEVLLDYHLAEAMARQKHADSTLSQEYLQLVLDKHGITAEELDSSLVYYTRHADQMEVIYAHLAERIENLARLQGIESSAFAENLSASGDTANIWQMASCYTLMPYVPNSMVSYRIADDSLFREGDIVRLTFQPRFFHQSGQRNGYAFMAVRFTNDSVATRTKTFTNDNKAVMEVNDTKRVGIKEISGFILARQPNNAKDRTNAALRLLYINDLMLVRMHTPEPEPKPEVAEDEETEELNAIDEIEIVTDSVTPNPRHENNRNKHRAQLRTVNID